jgi:phospholipid/cholesterol/gamma-HCH transport system substrate-binding protein
MTMPGFLSSTRNKVVAAAVAVAVVAGLLFLVTRSPAQKTAVAYFPVAIHLYPGSDVDVLGVKIGTVTSVTPQGTDVRVVMSYDAGQRIPANAQAMVDEPTLVADRVIELNPPYSSGAVLADGATIPLQRTHVPLELDQLSANLVQLAQALGPNGANRAGALARAIRVGAANLRGEGGQAHTTVTRLSELMATLGNNHQALFGTVRHLQKFTTTLATHDAQTRSFTIDLADVSQQLADENHAFSAALHNLGIALGQVTNFIRANRSAVASDVQGLASITHVLAKERILLAHMADMGAVGISNYPHMYTPSARTYNARFNNFDANAPALFFCQLYDSFGGNPQQCMQYLKPLQKLPLPKGGGAR